MCKAKTLLIMALIASLFSVLSCGNKDIYDEETHGNLIKYVSPVDSVDQKHTYLLSKAHTYSINCNAGVGAKKLEIYSESPITSDKSLLMSRVFCSEGSQVTLTVSVPFTLETLYAAVVNGDGLYTVTSFNKNTRAVDFSSPIATKQSPLFSTPKIQTYTYCYEDNFPEAGDYDYNDIVMRIGIERTGEKVLTVHTTLAAVGSEKQMAGAIRLVGQRFQDIDSVVAVGGKTYNEDVPSPSYGLIESSDLLLKGQNGEAVLNLFVDAHWAMGENMTVINGDFVRKYYNVSVGSTGTSQQIATRSRSFMVYFKNASSLNNLSFEMIDPFIMTYYVGARMEIHHNEFLGAQTFYNYNTIKFKDLPWCLKIPTGDFRYPLEGCQMGFRKKDESGQVAMFGAYMYPGHSFGEWMEDHNNYLDWYYEEYATPNQIY